MMTNFEKVKQMTVEEFAYWIGCITDRCFDKGQGYSECGNCPLSNLLGCCDFYIQEFLESEVEDDSKGTI